jgi:hypothetical protein
MVPLKNLANFKFCLFFFNFDIQILDLIFGSRYIQQIEFFVPLKLAQAHILLPFFLSKAINVTSTYIYAPTSSNPIQVLVNKS